MTWRARLRRQATRRNVLRRNGSSSSEVLSELAMSAACIKTIPPRALDTQGDLRPTALEGMMASAI
jgi:hypothetical protein